MKLFDYNPYLHNKAFDLLIHAVYAEGGDGNGKLICHYYDFEKIADAFEEYHKKHFTHLKLNKRISKHEIIFQHEQEGFTICDDTVPKHKFEEVCIHL